MKEIPFDELLEHFDPETKSGMLERIGEFGSTHVALMENLQMDSREGHYGAMTALLVGPNNTYKTVEELEGRHLNDLPSQRQYCTRFAVVPSGEGVRE